MAGESGPGSGSGSGSESRARSRPSPSVARVRQSRAAVTGVVGARIWPNNQAAARGPAPADHLVGLRLLPFKCQRHTHTHTDKSLTKRVEILKESETVWWSEIRPEEREGEI